MTRTAYLIMILIIAMPLTGCLNNASSDEDDVQGEQSEIKAQEPVGQDGANDSDNFTNISGLNGDNGNDGFDGQDGVDSIIDNASDEIILEFNENAILGSWRSPMKHNTVTLRSQLGSCVEHNSWVRTNESAMMEMMNETNQNTYAAHIGG